MHDFARVIAVYNLGKDGEGNFVGNERFLSERERNQLCSDTQKIMTDARFASFIAQSSTADLVNLMRHSPATFSAAWDSYKELEPLAEEKTASIQEMQPSTLS